ncbi:transketolase [Azospirillum sp. OGB3]|uniref:transketolase family protein n=1 Tax=Azospirillum sp. OGB3 TaxID=2587012 RepID=UPI0016066749|nr:transketolase C-terminal domain-containing protein [Azospirillum sp. OGB3]MBB3267912.1 transketolase [Azospirillum sp. OGB3]
MRRAFADTLVQMARADDRIIFLTGDLGFQVFDAFCAEFPRRYLNVGVAEAHLVDCAAGLALEGWRPVVYSIASFLTGRAFEQLRLSVGYHQLPVIVAGAGGGYIYAPSGVTHHAKEDVALMSLIPGMTVTVPGDPTEVAELLPQLARLPGPSYIRVGRFGEPRLDSAEPIEVGRGRCVRPGRGVAVLTTGGAVIPAVKAVDSLAVEGIEPLLAHFHTVRPLDLSLVNAAAAAASTFIIVEEHGIQGGLYNTVAAWAAEQRSPVTLKRLGPGDELVFGNPHYDDLLRQTGLEAGAIADTVRQFWSPD